MYTHSDLINNMDNMRISGTERQWSLAKQSN